MRQVSDDMILNAWERGVSEHQLDRALTLLMLAHSDVSRSDLASLSIADRDKRLFELTGRMFGPSLDLAAICPECDAETALAFDVAAAAGVSSTIDADRYVQIGDQSVHYRLPNSHDLAHALTIGSREKARTTLLKSIVDHDDPPEALLQSVDRDLRENAGLEVLTIGHACTECGHEQTTAFDIVDYLWRHVVAYGHRLMFDIHQLAQAYGWLTADILALSPARRAAHIAMVSR
ncbi:MAG: hypothetical protein ABJM90_00530 [Paracoccaceae bacterium]